MACPSPSFWAGAGAACPSVTQALAQGDSAAVLARNARRQGVALLVEGTVAPIVHGERVLGAVLVLHDVTEQRRHDEQLALDRSA